MESALALALWIADASVPGSRPERRAALSNGWKIAELAASDGDLEQGPNGTRRVARFLAELHDDGWVTFDFQKWPGDEDRPAAAAFSDVHLQRSDNVRLTPEGWRAVSAVRTQGLAYSTSEPEAGKRQFFISHASEDKAAVARPLAEELLRRGFGVWFDEFELSAGDSLRRNIDSGLSQSVYGVVILSPAFLKKEWPQRELDGLTARETLTGRKVILPIRHELNAETVAEYSPVLADKLGLPSDMGPGALADELERVLVLGGDQIGVEADQRPVAKSTSDPPPSGSVLDALLEQNEVRLTEVLKGLFAQFTRPIDDAILGRSEKPVTAEVFRELDCLIRKQVFDYAAELLALVDHSPGRLEEHFAALAEWAAREPESGYAHWMEVPRWACWCLAQLIGTYAIRTRSFAGAGAVMRARMSTRYGGVEPLVDGVPRSFGSDLADVVVEPPSDGRKWISNGWEYVGGLFDEESTFGRSTENDLRRKGDPKRAMGDWDFVHCLYLGLQGVRSAAYFSISEGGAREFALRLHQDEQLRARLAKEGFGLDLAELDAGAPEAFAHARSMGHFHDMDAVPLYLEGEI